MAEIKSESVADFSPESVADFPRNTHGRSFEFVSGSSKAEHGLLIVPGKRQTRVIQELRCRQIARLPAIEDGLRDIRRQIAEADEPHEIGALPLPLGKCSKRDA